MKKTIMYLKSVAVCGMMAALFIGCGNNSDSDDGSESESTPASMEEEENKVDSLAVLTELNTEYVTAQLQYRQYLTGDVPMPGIYQRNIMTVMINRRGEIMTEIAGNWHICPIESIKNRTIMFLTPCREATTVREAQVADDSPSLPCLKEDYTYPEIEEHNINGVGRIPVSKGIVFLLKDNDETPQATLNNVKDELVGAILEMRDIQSKKYLRRSYFQLTEEERQAVTEMIPMSIIETTHAELYESAPEPPELELEPVLDFEENFEVVSEKEIAAAEIEYYEQFPEEAEEVMDIIAKLPDVLAEFPGGQEALQKYLDQNIQYPKLARDNGITGTVYIRFVVEKDGRITDAKVVRDIGGGCGQEALRVVNGMPKWKPGKVDNKTVRSEFNLPVKFRL